MGNNELQFNFPIILLQRLFSTYFWILDVFSWIRITYWLSECCSLDIIIKFHGKVYNFFFYYLIFYLLKIVSLNKIILLVQIDFIIEI